MSTKITRIYASFLQKVSDYKFSLGNGNDREVIEKTMYGYYVSARAEFYQCPKDLSTNQDESDAYIESNLIIINDKLSEAEIEIIAMLMLVEYFRQIMIRNETLEQALGDSDFNIYSQANHINQLKDLHKEIKRETNVRVGRYTFASDVYDKRQ